MRCKDCSEVRGYPYKRSPSDRGARHQDFGERSTIDMVARRAVN
jgi:hypothetical protein